MWRVVASVAGGLSDLSARTSGETAKMSRLLAASPLARALNHQLSRLEARCKLIPALGPGLGEVLELDKAWPDTIRTQVVEIFNSAVCCSISYGRTSRNDQARNRNTKEGPT